jgi:hypothetical protein
MKLCVFDPDLSPTVTGAPSHSFDASICPKSRVRGVDAETSKFSNFFAGPLKSAKPPCPIKSRPLRKISGKHDNDVEHHRPIAATISHATMSVSASRALRRCICTARPAAYARPTIGATQQRIQRRWASGNANPKIATIVDQISQLTLLETADLVSTLKVGQMLWNWQIWPIGPLVEEGTHMDDTHKSREIYSNMLHSS